MGQAGFKCVPTPMYTNRFTCLKLETLEYHRIKTDFYECFKITNRLVSIEPEMFFTFHDHRLTRGTRKSLEYFILVRGRSFFTWRKNFNFFINRVDIL